MRKSSVRVISIDRSRSGITNAADPMHSDWRVFFRLSPRQSREWDYLFEKVQLTQHINVGLTYQHRLIRESRLGEYVYGTTKRRFGYSMRHLFRRSLAYGVEVVCPASSEDLQRATLELTRLVANTNGMFTQAVAQDRQSDTAARVSSDRLVAALRSVEGQLKTGSLHVVLPERLSSPK